MPKTPTRLTQPILDKLIEYRLAGITIPIAAAMVGLSAVYTQPILSGDLPSSSNSPSNRARLKAVKEELKRRQQASSDAQREKHQRSPVTATSNNDNTKEPHR